MQNGFISMIRAMKNSVLLVNRVGGKRIRTKQYLFFFLIICKSI